MTDGLFHVERMKQCACGGECRPGQRNCHICHAAANRAYRLRMSERRAENHAAQFKAIFGPRLNTTEPTS